MPARRQMMRKSASAERNVVLRSDDPYDDSFKYVHVPQCIQDSKLGLAGVDEMMQMTSAQV